MGQISVITIIIMIFFKYKRIEKRGMRKKEWEGGREGTNRVSNWSWFTRGVKGDGNGN